MNDRSKHLGIIFVLSCMKQLVSYLPQAGGCLLITFATVDFARGQTTLPLQHLWEVQPNLGDIWTMGNQPRSVYIDFDRLLSNDPQIRLDTARVICANYDRPGFGDKAKAIERLIAALARSDETVLARRALISAACLLDDGTNAGRLWELSRNDTVSDHEVQEALIRWESDSALDSWRNVLRDPTSPSALTKLAIRGLGVRETNEDKKLLAAILESESASIEHRLLAAKSLGNIQTTGLTPLARKYMESNLPEREMIAVSLLSKHTDDDALQLILAVHEKGVSPAKRRAAEILANQSQKISEELAQGWLNDSDVHFRELALQVASAGDSFKAIEVAGRLLRDNEERLRRYARRDLLELASGHREVIDALIKRELSGDDWRSIEQSIILIAELRDSSRCEELLSLLDHPQPEVHMHAAWALRDLSEAGPILDRLLEKAAALTDSLEQESKPFGKSNVIMLSLVLETFGRHKDERAYEMLTKYIPKNDYKMGNLSRASAIWAIGQIKRNEDNPELRAKLRERIKDLPPEKPENYLVRFNCILALGEFGFQESQEVIEQYSGAPPNPLGYAGIWAKEQFKNSGK